MVKISSTDKAWINGYMDAVSQIESDRVTNWLAAFEKKHRKDTDKNLREWLNK